jgi:hypothetical protein
MARKVKRETRITRDGQKVERSLFGNCGGNEGGGG